ncbi:sulfate/molybdate ABC transporter ATP-binding protein [Blastochloris viridis]|uniref:Sulfate and thiosulfate import ATP-binding protein CysA n=1 Tax=Blastochloris viridis TaxID=1079 RepID=A0A0H5BIJ0_BLAVI|nr:sulfate/molybdate ABC transporter ATP-binding protein [Blastochloris viridis]ALK09829.1 Sulfate/thiosulfate import ATP-binding protein CysA [Blastochloris viridis]BAS00267.1 sulfate and thiosulfate import ATP-binding protein CysA [Blastochloris viridis]CUU42492.1 Sulfate/thiosulfate import ATP-binding protein CysA [Blastochloris viridis]
MNALSPASSQSHRSWPGPFAPHAIAAHDAIDAAEAVLRERGNADRLGTVDVRAEGISKRFADTAALADVTLNARAGELVALLGPSGSGKTTLLRIVAGLEQASAGRILLGGEDATQVPVQDRGVGFMFQSYALFRHLTVADNIAYGLKVRPRAARPSAAIIRARVTELLELVQLPGIEKRYPSQLSGGQRQRVALARALAVDPKVLLLDEPFGALDAKVRRDLRRWLRDIHERTGHTTLFVTHDQDEALEIADRVAILNQGRLEQIGTPDEIYEHPATAFVAGFIGESARLPVEAAGGGVRIGAHTLPMNGRRVPDGPAALFVRPRDLVMARSDGGATAPQTLPAHVAAVRRAGATRRAELRFGDSLPPVEMEVPVEVVLAKGDNIRVAFTHVRVFSA